MPQLAGYQRTTTGNEFRSTPIKQATPIKEGKGRQMAKDMYGAKVANWTNKFDAKLDKLKAQYLQGKIGATEYHSSLGSIYSKMKGDAPTKALKYKYRVAVAQQQLQAEKASKSGGGGRGGGGGGKGRLTSGVKETRLKIQEALDANEQAVAMAKSDVEDGEMDARAYIETVSGLTNERKDILQFGMQSDAPTPSKKKSYEKQHGTIERSANDVNGEGWYGGIEYMNENREQYVTKTKADGRKVVSLDPGLVGEDRAFSQSDNKDWIQGGDGSFYEVDKLVQQDTRNGNLNYFDNQGNRRTIPLDAESAAGTKYYDPMDGQEKMFSEKITEAESQLDQLKGIEYVRMMNPQDPANAKMIVQADGGGWKDLGMPADSPVMEKPSFHAKPTDEELAVQDEARRGQKFTGPLQQGEKRQTVGELEDESARRGQGLIGPLQEGEERPTIGELEDQAQEHQPGTPYPEMEPDISIPEFKEEMEDPRTQQVQGPEHQKVGQPVQPGGRSVDPTLLPPGAQPNQQINLGEDQDPMQTLMQGQQATQGGFGQFKNAFNTKLQY